MNPDSSLPPSKHAVYGVTRFGFYILHEAYYVFRVLNYKQ